MDSKFIQKSVQRWLYDCNHHYQALNYARSGYFEADVLGVTLYRMVTEIEVKISLSDYKADFKKVAKHERLLYGKHSDIRPIPNLFLYACPDGLIKEVPEYAGLLWINELGSVMVVKSAPKLHREKATDKLMLGMLNNLTEKSIFEGVCWMTYEARQRKIAFEKQETERKQKTADFIKWSLEKKEASNQSNNQL